MRQFHWVPIEMSISCVYAGAGVRRAIERIQSSRATQHIKHKRIKFIAQCVHSVHGESVHKSMGLCTMWRAEKGNRSALGGGAVFVYARRLGLQRVTIVIYSWLLYTILSPAN